MTDAISRMRIEVSEEVLDDLRRRLAATRFPDQIPGSGWDYGTDGAYLRELCSYWRDKFDWRAQEALLNRFDHHRTTIDGQMTWKASRSFPPCAAGSTSGPMIL